MTDAVALPLILNYSTIMDPQLLLAAAFRDRLQINLYLKYKICVFYYMDTIPTFSLTIIYAFFWKIATNCQNSSRFRPWVHPPVVLR